MFTRFLLKLDLQLFSADGTEGGGGYMVNPEHLQNVYTDTDNPEPTAVEGGDIDGTGNSELPEGGQPEMTPEEIQDLIDFGEGIGKIPLDEARKGYLRQSDYTRKTQEVAEFRKEYDTLKQQMEQYSPVHDIFRVIEQDPRLQDQFSQMMNSYFYGGQGQNPEGQPEQAQFDPRYNQLQQQLQQTQSQFEQQQQIIQQWQEQQAVEQATREWNELANKYPDAGEMQEQIYQFAIDNNVNLDMAYRIMNYDKVAQRTQEQMVANQKKRQVARTVAPSNPSGAVQPPSGKPKSYSDVLAQIMADGYKLDH